MIDKLDIGNTMWNDGQPIEDKGWTCIDPRNDPAVTCLDTIPGKIAGDMNAMPFANNTFIEIFGSCYLEGDTETEEFDLAEIHRVLKPSGVAKLTSCGVWNIQDPNMVDLMFKELAALTRAIVDSKLTVVSMECRDIYDDNEVSYPMVTLRKE